MKAVIVSSSYSYLDRVKLVQEFYWQQGYETTVLLTDFIHASKSYVQKSEKDYIFIKTKSYKKNISVQRLYSHHKFAKDVAAQLDKMQIDLLHMMLPANSLAKVGRRYKEKHPDTKLFFDINDLWPETMPIERLKNTFPFKKWKNLRDQNLGNADRVYCECDLFKKVMKKEEDERFRTLYWVKGDKPLVSKPMLSEDELHLCYLGSINNVIDIDYIVEMCQKLGEHKKVVLHVVGDGERREELLQKLKRAEVDVHYHGLIYGQEEKQKLFDQCHFGLNIMKPSVCVGLTMKSLDYFQGGIPIINNIQGDTYEMVENNHIGYNGYSKLLNDITELGNDDYLQMRKCVRELYQRQFTKEAFFDGMK